MIAKMSTTIALNKQGKVVVHCLICGKQLEPERDMKDAFLAARVEGMQYRKQPNGVYEFICIHHKYEAGGEKVS